MKFSWKNGKDESGMRKNGFTIVEVMVVVVVITIIFGAFFTVLLANQRTWHCGEMQIQIHQQARRGMQRMLTELRHSDHSLIGHMSYSVGIDDTDIITFQVQVNSSWGDGVTPGNSVRYLLGGLDNSQLLRRILDGYPAGNQVGNDTVLANNIIDLQFVTNQLVDVTLTASRQSTFQDTLTTTLHSRVRPRN